MILNLKRIAALEAMGWQFLPFGPEEWQWMKFDAEGHRIASQLDAVWYRDIKQTKGEATMTIQLGDPVEDIITGFKGVAVERMTWLYGCRRILIVAFDHKLEDAWFDEQRVTLYTGEDAKKIPVTPVVTTPDDPQLGDAVEDSVTGYSGLVSGISEGYTGRTTLVLEPPKLDKDGKMLDSKVFDRTRVVVTERAKPKLSKEAKSATALPPGGPQKDFTRSRRHA